MVSDEAGGFAFMESVEFFAVDGGHSGFGGDKIIAMGRMGKMRDVSCLPLASHHVLVRGRILSGYRHEVGATCRPTGLDCP
jgi:hypothetical protein